MEYKAGDEVTVELHERAVEDVLRDIYGEDGFPKNAMALWDGECLETLESFLARGVPFSGFYQSWHNGLK